MCMSQSDHAWQPRRLRTELVEVWGRRLGQSPLALLDLGLRFVRRLAQELRLADMAEVLTATIAPIKTTVFICKET